MKLITRNTDYAIRALAFIAKNSDRVVSTSEMVAGLRIPRPFLRKILQALHKKRLLNAYKGQGGGFSLAVKPSKICLIDLIRIFQGPLKLNECMLKRSICPNIKTCKLKKKIDNIEKYVIAQLKPVSIASLLK